MDNFTVTWEIEDGYAGGSRPQTFKIEARHLEDDMAEEDLRDLFWQEVERDLAEKVHAISGDEEAFIAWAKGRCTT